MPRVIEQRAAPSTRTALHLQDERSTVTQSAHADNSLPGSFEQLPSRAIAAVDAAVMAVEAAGPALTKQERETLCAKLSAATVLVQASTIPLKEAAFRAGRSCQTVAAWSAKFGIGRRVGGRHVIDVAKLAALMAGGQP